MSGAGLRLRPALPADLPWLGALERAPANAPFLCAWTADRHAASLADADRHYLVIEDREGQRRGFVILAGLRSPQRAVELVRIAVDAPGRGLGSTALRQVVDRAFGELAAKRLWLDVFADNARARRVYQRLGFREEGRLAEAVARGDGTRGTLIVMALTAAASGA